MAIWRKLMGVLGGSGTRQAGQQYGGPAYGGQSATPVTMESALQLSAVWSCVRLISESVASLPITVYRVDPKTGAREPAPDHPLQVLFNGKVNRWQTRQEFFETITYQLVLMGNNYVVKQLNSAGQIISLIPLMNQQVEVSLQDSGEVLYRYTSGTDVNVYSSKTVWHNKLFGNGIIGLSPLEYARNSIGIGQAAEKSTTKIYNNGGKPSGVLTIDKVLGEEQRRQVKQNFAEMAEGNQDRLYVLEAGMEYQQISLSPQDIELLQSRRFQIEDIARFFGVPSVLINDTSSNTTWGSGIQQIVQGFYKLGLRPYLERYEASMKAWLLSPEERQTIDLEFNFDALLQPELSERVKTGRDAVQGGLITPNEWRKHEGKPPKEGGDNLIVQKQMRPLDKIGENENGKKDAV